MPGPGADSDRRSVRAVLVTHRTATFLGIAFGLSWLVWSLVLLDVPLGVRAWGRLRQGILFAGGLGPFVAALVVAWLGERGGDRVSGDEHRDRDEQDRDGRGGEVHGTGDVDGADGLRGEGATEAGDVVGWVRTQLRLDIPRRWILVGLGGPLALHAATVLVYDGLGGPITVDVAIGSMLPVLPLLVVHHTVWAGGDEELGWRSVLQTDLRARLGLLPTTLAVGAAWALWHVPLFVLPTGLYRKQHLVAFLGAVLAIGVLLGLLYEASAGSVVPAMLFHGTWNALDPYRPIPVWTLSPPGSLTLESRAELLVLWGAVALAVLAVLRRRRAGV